MRTEDEKTGEIKKTESQPSKSKITPFRFPYSESDDPVVDAFILQGLQEEADEAEARINSDPELSQINPPDDQYEKIVARLKEMGVWEEDEEEKKRTEEEHEKEVEEARKEIAAANREKKAKEREEVGAAETESESEAADGVEMCGRKDSGERVFARSILEEEELYKMLSEKDREAIALGRRAQEKREKRCHRIRMVVKRGGVVAAAFVLLIGVSMNVSASRQWIVQMWGAVTEAFATRTVTNNIEETKAIQSAVAESLAAMEEIEKITGIPGLYFNYWPEGMEYLGYEVLDEDFEVHMFYLYDEHIAELYMKNTDYEETNYYVSDGNVELTETFDIMLGIEVEIWHTDLKEGVEKYRAEFVYEDYRYIFDGYFSLEEFRELVKNLNFLSDSL